jgi:hypothetical protein
MSDLLIISGSILMMLGVFSLVAQAGNYVEYRLMQRLKHYGVDGQAVYAFKQYVTNSNRAFFDVILPEGQAPARFREYMRELPGPEGTVVPVVYDKRKPSRAKTGTREELDFDPEGWVVRLFVGAGLALMVTGALLCLVGALV